MKDIYVLGSLNMDLVITTPKEVLQGETVHGSNFMTNCGGKGANQAAACGKLGANVYMGGCVGNDGFGDKQIAQMTSFNVNMDNIRKIDGVSTGVAVIVILNGDNRIILDGGANLKVEQSDVDKLLSNAKEGDIFLTQLENDLSIVDYALMKAKEKKMVTILNPAPMDVSIVKSFQYVDIIVPNETEFALLTGTECVITGAKKLFEMGIKDVIVTLGSKGYCYYNGKDIVNEDCIKMNVVDTTAAGDTFCGALATRLSKGEKIEDALRYANKAAALSVTKQGAQQSIPSNQDIAGYFGK